MRVLTFTKLYPNSLQPWSATFVEQRLVQLVRRHDVEARVVAPVPWFPFRHAIFGRYAIDAAVPARESRAGIDVYHPRYPVIPKVGMLAAPSLMTWAVKPLVQSIVRDGFDFDLIDAHFFYPDGIAALAIGRALAKPVVVTARGTDVHTYFDHPLVRKRIVRAATAAAAVITVSENLRDILVGHGVPGDKIVTLRNGVDTELFFPGDRQALREKLGYEGRVVLSVGNLRAVKGQDLTIEAVAGMDETSLVIVGNGEEERALKRLAERIGGGKVRFRPAMSQSALREHYTAADALVLASKREGMPNVVLEAMACGTPAVVTDLPGVEAIVARGTGCRVMKERSPRGLRDALCDLFEHYPDREEVRQQAGAFDWSETSRGQWTLFGDVLRRHRPAHASPANAAR